MDLYAENILEHFRHPHHKSPLPRATIEHGEVNASCGDEITIRLRLKNDMIERICWEGEGCAISQAAMSMLSETLEGKTLKHIEGLAAKDILNMLGVTVGPRRLKCALLSLLTLRNTFRKYRNLPEEGWRDVLLRTQKINGAAHGN